MFVSLLQNMRITVRKRSYFTPYETLLDELPVSNCIFVDKEPGISLHLVIMLIDLHLQNSVKYETFGVK